MVEFYFNRLIMSMPHTENSLEGKESLGSGRVSSPHVTADTVDPFFVTDPLVSVSGGLAAHLAVQHR